MNKVAACAKHYVGDGGTTKGINENNTVVSYNGLLRIHMPAYHDSIVKGVSTVMVSYSSWNGQKMHANHFLVTDYLKNKLKFRVINKTYLISSPIKQLTSTFGSFNLNYVPFWFSKFCFLGQLSLFLKSENGLPSN